MGDRAVVCNAWASDLDVLQPAVSVCKCASCMLKMYTHRSLAHEDSFS